MHTSYLKPALDKNGNQLKDPTGAPLVEEVFGLNPDTPEPAPTAGQRRHRRPFEEADLVDESVIAAQLQAARAEQNRAEGRAMEAEALLRAEQVKTAQLESVMKSLGTTPEQVAEAIAKMQLAQKKK